MFGIDLLGFARDFYTMFMDMLVKFIAVTVDFSGIKIVQDMIGNAQGVGIVISGYIAIVMIITALVIQRYRLNALLSFIIVIMGPLGYVIWLALLDGLRAIGAGLTSIIAGFDVTQIKSSIVLPFPPLDITAALWNVPIFILSGSMGFWFMLAFAMMALFSIIVAVVGIWLIAAYGFGPRTRRAFSIAMSLAIVSLCLGQPAVLAIIKLSNLVGNLMPVTPGSVGLAGLFGLAGMNVAWWVLLALPFLVYFPVHSVMGKVVSSVSNRVRTQVDNKHRVDAKVSGKVNTTQTNRLASTQKASYRTAMGTEIRRQAGATGSTALMGMLTKLTATAAAAGSNVHPALKATYIGGAAVLRGIGNAPPKQKKEKGHRVYS